MMLCEYCGKEMQIKIEENYKYEESGLSNVYLEKAEFYHCVTCKVKLLRLHKVLGLHKAIARAIVLQEVPLNGADIRFLRSERGLKAKELAKLLRVDVATVSRWETNSQELRPQSDALIRTTYALVYQEQEGNLFPEAVTQKVASVKAERDSNFSIYINQKNIIPYTYKDFLEMAC
jgi:putative zinc finger/helix-turn-helix YgiT family protein